MFMKTAKEDARSPSAKESNNNENNLPGYPIYPENEDIYNNFLEEKDIDPEDIQKKKSHQKNTEGRGLVSEIDNELPGSDLDIPGSELDDEMEIIGSEDEENNYYSLGGDDHIDLEENRGE